MIASTQTNHPLAAANEGAGAGSSPIEEACTRLKTAGLRVTQPRLAILDVLIAQSRPLSIEAIHEHLNSKTCDLVTVYRCMAAFEAIGLVRRAFLNNGTSLYEIRIGDSARYHVACKNTNRVDMVSGEAATELHRALLKVEEHLSALGYSEINHIVEFFGVSPAGHRVSEPQAAVTLVPPSR